jgi:hypothetical protein
MSGVQKNQLAQAVVLPLSLAVSFGDFAGMVKSERLSFLEALPADALVLGITIQVIQRFDNNGGGAGLTVLVESYDGDVTYTALAADLTVSAAPPELGTYQLFLDASPLIVAGNALYLSFTSPDVDLEDFDEGSLVGTVHYIRTGAV